MIDNCEHMMYNRAILIADDPNLRYSRLFGYAGAGLRTEHIVQSVVG